MRAGGGERGKKGGRRRDTEGERGGDGRRERRGASCVCVRTPLILCHYVKYVKIVLQLFQVEIILVI